eukprot:3865947-Rhodomonas_salina.2
MSLFWVLALSLSLPLPQSPSLSPRPVGSALFSLSHLTSGAKPAQSYHAGFSHGFNCSEAGAVPCEIKCICSQYPYYSY